MSMQESMSLKHGWGVIRDVDGVARRRVDALFLKLECRELRTERLRDVVLRNAFHFYASLISSSLHSHVTLYLEWCDKIKLSNLLLPRKSGTIYNYYQLPGTPHGTPPSRCSAEQVWGFGLGTPLSARGGVGHACVRVGHTCTGVGRSERCVQHGTCMKLHAHPSSEGTLLKPYSVAVYSGSPMS